MIPGKYNIVCPQGSTLQQQFVYKVDDTPVDLTGYSARMQVREKHTSKIPTISINTTSGGMTVDNLGAINIEVSASSTEDLVAKEYVYDLEIISSSNIVTRLIEGKFLVTPEVTR